MGLQVWLPLNGDAKNQGLNQTVEFVNNNVTYESGGKCGQCASFNGSSSRLSITNFSIGNNWSYGFWAYSTQTSRGWEALVVLNNNGGDADTQLGIFINTSGNRFQTTANGQYNSQVPYSYANKWTHYFATFNGSTLITYINGVKVNEKAITNGLLSKPNLTIGARSSSALGGASGSALFFLGKINDVRIYDHTLAPREVKELARGLRVHYKLNDLCSLSSTIDPAGTWNIYNNNSVPASLTGLTETYLSAPVRRLSMTPTSATLSAFRSSLWSRGVYNWRQTFAANTKYCFWIYYRPVSHTDVRVGGTASNIGGWTEIAPEAVGNGWYRVGQYRNGTVTEAKTDNIFVSFYCPSAEVDVPVVIDFACPTLIVGYTTIQPFLNYNINNTIVYDVSGLNNNGTILNSITTESSPTRYAAAAFFNGTNAKIRLPALDFSGMANTYTFSWWQYNISTGNMPWGFSNGNRLNVYHCNPLCWNTGDGASNQFKDGSTTIAPGTLTNAWHHMAVTGDGTSTKLYIDGVYRGTATTYKPLTGTQIYISGWDTSTSYTFNGSKISDFRIYSTTLSQEDIRELYAASAEIDRRGAFYTRELVE